MAKPAGLKNWIFSFVAVSAVLISVSPQSSANPLMAAPFFLLGCFLVLSGKLSNLKLHDPVLLCLLLLWLGWTLGAAGSAVPFASQVTWVILSILPVAYLCASGRDILRLLYIICALVTLLAASTFYYMFAMTGHYWRARLFFEDENILGALIALIIPFTANSLFTANKNWKILIGVSLVILAGGLMLTQSRSGFIAAVIGIVPVLLKNRHYFSKKDFKFILPLILASIAGIIATGIGDRLLLALQMDKDVIGRLAIWRSALEMFALHPLAGVGLGVFHLYYPPFKSLSDNSLGFWVHMDPLQWAVESGGFTALAFYALSGVIAYKYTKRELPPLQIGAGASLLSVFITAHLGYVLHYVPILIISGLLLSFFAPAQSEPSRLRLISAASLTLVVLCGISFLTKIAPTLYLWTNAIDASNRHDVKNFTRYLQLCIDKGDPQFPGCRIEAARFIIESSSAPSRDVFIWLDEVDRADPVEKDSSYLRAEYYLKIAPQNLQAAIGELNKSLAIDPSYWQARQKLVALWQAQGNNKEAYKTLETARKYQISSQYLDEFYKMETELSGKVNK